MRAPGLPQAPTKLFFESSYGVSVGKKFDGDPLVYKVVDGSLYFNRNPKIQETWEDDLSGNIEEAAENWTKIRDKQLPASDHRTS